MTESVQVSDDFTIEVNGEEKSCYNVLQYGSRYKERAENDPEKAEYFVRVQWLDTRPENQAFNEVGLFGNQNTVCQPTTPKWRHTVEQLKAKFSNWDKS